MLAMPGKARGEARARRDHTVSDAAVDQAPDVNEQWGTCGGCDRLAGLTRRRGGESNLWKPARGQTPHHQPAAG
eukprot:6497424-Pyramimonas_sp.AAC.1